jgi:hypothetical protein
MYARSLADRASKAVAERMRMFTSSMMSFGNCE